jgi:ATP-binding cassette subfamily C protein CydC
VSGWFITATAITGLGILSINSYNLFLPSAIIRFLALIKPPLKYYERLYNHKLTFQLAGLTRVWIFKRVFKSDKESLAKFRDIDFTSRITTDVNQLDQLLIGLLVPWLVNFVIFVLVLTYFLKTLPVLGILITGVYIGCGVMIPIASLKTGLKMANVYTAQRQLEAHLSDHINGYKELLSYGLFDRYSAEARSLISTISRCTQQALNTKSFYSFVQALILETGLIVSLIIVCYMHHSPDGPSMVLAILVILALFESILPLATLFYEQADTFRAARNLTGSIKDDHAVIKEDETFRFAPGNGITITNLTFGYKARVLYQGVNIVKVR